MIDAKKSLSDFTEQIKAAGVTVDSIVLACVEDNPLDWRVYAKIIPDYMPPYPRPDTQPRVVVEFRGQFLRHNRGPRQGWFWDGYGDDLKTPGLAFKALLEAPCPCLIWFKEAHCKEAK